MHEKGQHCQKSHHLPVIISGILFVIIALIHIWRIFMGWSVTVDGQEIPMWASIVGAIVTGLMAVWIFCACRCKKCHPDPNNPQG